MNPWLIAVAIVCLSIISIHALSLRERKAQREFERQLNLELSKELDGLAKHLRERAEVQDRAVASMIKQISELVGFSNDRRKEAEGRVVAAGMQGRSRGQ